MGCVVKDIRAEMPCVFVYLFVSFVHQSRSVVTSRPSDKESINMRLAFASLLLSISLLAACGGDDGPSGPTVSLTFENLPTLGAGYVYEAWVVVGGEPVSAGTFGTRPSFTGAFIADDASAATAVLISIEPNPDMNPAPSNTKILGGDIVDGSATLTIGHGGALGSDYTEATGKFVLATPTTSATNDENQGIWFATDTPTGTLPLSSLMLPAVATGWTYEGWVIDTSTNPPTPHSTGKFIDGDPTKGDDDNAGPDAGTENLAQAREFAGQDYIDPARVLSMNHQAAITIEPVPDDKPNEPFALKPLANTITMAVAPQAQDFVNQYASDASALVKGSATVQ